MTEASVFFEKHLFSTSDGKATVGGVRVADVARQFATPFYVFDGQRIREAVADLAAVPWKPKRLFYSVKAHACVRLLQLIRQLGVGADVCSAGDLAFAQAAGFGADEISWVGFGGGSDELSIPAKEGIQFTADSVSQLERFASLAPAGTSVGLRIRPGIVAGTHTQNMAASTTAKFGLSLEDLNQALRVAQTYGLEVGGLHCHLGSDLLSPKPHLEALSLLLDLSAPLLDVRWVNLGGGFGAPFTHLESRYDIQTFGRDAATILGAMPREVELRLEPGTFLVRESGFLVTRVNEIKQVSGEKVLILDASTNQLVGALTLGARHPVVAASRAEEMTTKTTLAGNLMLGGDIMIRDVELPEVELGEVIIFGLAGAYCGSRQSTFNGRGRIAEILVDNGEVALMRTAETPADLLAHDVWEQPPS